MQTTPHPAIRGLVALLASLALLLAMDTLRLFGNQQWLQGLIGIETQYFYALLGLLAPWAFITYPTKPWIDWPLVVLSIVILGGFVTAEQALDEAWEFVPDQAVYGAIALWLILLEALRRAAGWPVHYCRCIFSAARYYRIHARSIERPAFNLGRNSVLSLSIY